MKKIEGTPKTIRELFTGVKYSIHYYQREYRWRRKNVEELIDDLTSEFFDQYSDGDSLKAVNDYGHYFMGSVVLTQDENAIIDGQQRLTSISLLLIYLYHAIDDVEDKSELLTLFYSKKLGEKSFNINVPERATCLNAIKNKEPFDPEDQPESVQTIYARWVDICELMDDAFAERRPILTFFKEWLIDHVDFIRIEAQTEQDAHKIFVSMNDRGLSLTPTEMLKGFLLSEIADDQERYKANGLWKKRILELKSIDKEGDSDFIKNWLRSQYAEDIRERKKGAQAKDFDIIGTTFHKWVREHTAHIGLTHSDRYFDFVHQEFSQFSDLYMLIIEKSNQFDPQFRHVYYNAKIKFTLQPMLLLAAISRGDDQRVAYQKIRIVSCFLDIYLTRRIFNYRTIDYSASTYSMFALSKRIRGLSVDDLYILLREELETMEISLDKIDRFKLTVWTIRYMQALLARITSYIEVGSDMEDRYTEYTDWKRKNRYEVEHLIPNHYEMYTNRFDTEEEFERYRNSFGSLVLLPKDKNASYNDMPFSQKLPQYLSENLLARSLNERCYVNHPRFLRFVAEEGYAFTSYTDISKEMLEERLALYKSLAEEIWGIDTLTQVYHTRV